MSVREPSGQDALGEHFEHLFNEDADPWGYRTRW